MIWPSSEFLLHLNPPPTVRNSPRVLENVAVDPTLTAVSADDRPVAVQIPDVSSQQVALLIGLVLGHVLTVSVVTPDQLHDTLLVKFPALLRKCAEHASIFKARWRKRLMTGHFCLNSKPLSLTCVHVIAQRSHFRWSNPVTVRLPKLPFPLPPGARAADRTSSRANPRNSAVIDKCVRC